MMLIRKLLLLLGLLLSCGLVQAAPTTNTSEFHLKNGLTLIVREDHRAPVVLASIWYKVGGSYEHDGITGISHMLEHMMFKGTKAYGPGELIKMVSDNGGQQNAMTSADYTTYYQVWSKDKLPLSFKLEADRMRGLVLNPTLYTKEHQVVMEERRLRIDDNPQAITYERFNAAAFVNNPYHHPVIGWMTDVEHLTLEDLKQWYHTWYVPNNAIVVVVGDVHPQHVLQLAQQYFGSIKAQPVPAVKPRVEISGVGVRHINSHIPAQIPWLVMGYNVPSLVTAKNPKDAYALEMIAGILDAGNSSRLAKNLVRGNQIAVGASADYNLYAKYSTLFVLSGVPASNHSLKDLRKALTAQINDLKQHLVDATELARIKAQVIAQNVYDKDSLMNQAMDIGIPEASGLNWQVSADFVNQINAITPKQIQAAAKQYLKNSVLTIATLKPKKQAEPSPSNGQGA